MNFGSVCSGIEAASVAWDSLGWSASWFAEIEPFPSAVLAHHYPDVPNLGDMATIARRVLTSEVDAPDVLCGGTPCQAFSVAGLRNSLEDARGNLTLKFVGIANAIAEVQCVALVPSQVRRLTPEECEKLQGFLPGYTAIPWRGKPADQCPDGPRYKALGNSWAVPNVRWIGKRINAAILRLEHANDNNRSEVKKSA